jgi:hypothetical protein
MRILFGGIVLLLLSMAGEWGYRTFVRAIDQPTSELRAVAAYLASSGLQGKLAPVQHGFRHSAVAAVAAYRVDGQALPFMLVHCPSEAAAERALQRSPNRETARRNGAIVLQFPFLAADADSMVERVL